MNKLNETIVSSEILKKLRESKIDSGYEPVPKELETKAKQLLGSRGLASMDADFKRRLRNKKKAKRRAGIPGY